MTGADGRDHAAEGRAMHALMTELFPICRSLTGDGVRRSLEIIGRHVPLAVHEVPSGTRVFDWVVPDEWNIRDAYVMNAAGERVIDFRASNLHVMGYSEPVDAEMDLAELKPHLFSLPELPDAIPYRTSYYQRRWGFCLSQRQLDALPEGRYRVRIDSTLAPGALTYGELVIPGDGPEEVLLSTNICHPSMANNELSGPVMLVALGQWLAARSSRRFTYRLLFLPETIGAVAYCARHGEHLRRNVVAGWQVVCTGGPQDYVYVRARADDALVNRLTAHVLAHSGRPHVIEDYRWRGSDERQWNSPGMDLPVGMLAKSKFEQYPAYHTSLDDLDYVRAEHLAECFGLYRLLIQSLEANRSWRLAQPCEPRLGHRGLWSQTGGSTPVGAELTQLVLALIGYCDGKEDLLSIADRHGAPIWAYAAVVDKLAAEGVLV